MSAQWTVVLGVVLNSAALLAIGFVSFVRNEDEATPLDRMRALLRRHPHAAGSSLQSIKAHASGIAERSLDRSGRRGIVETTLERAGLNVRAGEFVVAVACGAFVGLMVGALLGGVIVGLLFGAAVVGGAVVTVRVLVSKRCAKFESQLEQTLPLMSGSMRAGFGIMQALDAVARESDSPTSEEFGRLVMEARLGRDLGDSLHALAGRVESEDFAFVVQAIEIHREVGGDLAEVLDNVGSTIRDRNRVRRQIKTLTAEGRISAAILLSLPIGMFFVVQLLNANYLHELTGTTPGRVMLAAGIALMSIGAVWMRRLIRLVF